ncbi:hypothetical protein EJ03DRAFT_330221 [Teratosphaeria nubilosa]|uniref:Sodium/calcium exchanger membrane region domain-containing protein n=1 Tax=Teratosphaeria nubilosa TaxID=161662 RepID=A0A6G1L1R7_9PEZI|nr:hypothetical protein EJ03DRAFT_330221 [Teratosphaeria nubilosa]
MARLYQTLDRYLFSESEDQPGYSEDRRWWIRGPASTILSICRAVWLICTSSWTTLLLLCGPLALALDAAHIGSPANVFIAWLGTLPLAAYCRYASELISVRLPSGASLAYQSTLAPYSLDLELALIALFCGQERLVKQYMVGKVVTTLLLTLGLSYSISGIFREGTVFNQTAVSTLSALLAAGITILSIASFLGQVVDHHRDPQWRHSVDRLLCTAAAIVLLLLYVAWRYFRHLSHSRLWDVEYDPDSVPSAQLRDTDRRRRSPIGLPACVITILLAGWYGFYLSQLMLPSPDSGKDQTQVTTLVGFTLLPILPEVAEVGSLWSLAVSGRMDIALEAAAGTSVQNIYVTIPLLCLFGQARGIFGLLALDTFSLILLWVGVWIFAGLVADGKGNYLKGAASIALYLIMLWALYCGGAGIGEKE